MLALCASKQKVSVGNIVSIRIFQWPARAPIADAAYRDIRPAQHNDDVVTALELDSAVKQANSLAVSARYAEVTGRPITLAMN